MWSAEDLAVEQMRTRKIYRSKMARDLSLHDIEDAVERGIRRGVSAVATGSSDGIDNGRVTAPSGSRTSGNKRCTFN